VFVDTGTPGCRRGVGTLLHSPWTSSDHSVSCSIVRGYMFSVTSTTSKSQRFGGVFEATGECSLQPRRDHGVRRMRVGLGVPHAERAVLTAQVISDDIELVEPWLGSVERIELLGQGLDRGALSWP
jgi:hypothetical protein